MLLQFNLALTHYFSFLQVVFVSLKSDSESQTYNITLKKRARLPPFAIFITSKRMLVNTQINLLFSAMPLRTIHC